jgi:hypothetical protein
LVVLGGVLPLAMDKMKLSTVVIDIGILLVMFDGALKIRGGALAIT